MPSALVHSLSLSLSLLSLSQYFSMEGDYLELSQFPYNSYPSSLGTIKFLTIGIQVIDLDTDERDRRELWKELRQMVNKVSENVKVLYESHNAILERVKALAKSNKAMNEELSRSQEGLEICDRKGVTIS